MPPISVSSSLRALHALPVLLLAGSSLACAHPASVSAPVPRVPEPAPVPVAYRVLRSGDGDGVVLSGRLDVGSRDDGHAESNTAHHEAGTELHLWLRPDYETPVVRVKYEELGPGGALIKCESAVRVAKGVPVRAECSGGSWSRVVELTVQ